MRIQLAECMLKDQRKFRRRLDNSGLTDIQIKALEHRIQASMANRAERLAKLPTVIFNEALPIHRHIPKIVDAIRENPIVIIAGETGSGKTTQIPKICLSIGRGVSGVIGHTQPRRLGARTIASRVAQELKTELGNTVGYKVRFTDKVSASSYIKLMTDGILLAEIQNDRYLNDYDTIIIDEAHERSLNIDFLLGYIKRLIPKRPELRLIITSATIDTERFSQFYGGAPIIEVSGRTYPVEVRYRPLDRSQEHSKPKDRQQAVLDSVNELASSRDGHVLVFFSGEREIREAAEALRKHHPPQTEILPLYARLGSAEQSRVFSPGKYKRIVLATNVAETSLTVPGIRYVIDTGKARISRYSYRSKIQRLPIEDISQSSANQRKGRCGRLSNGICIRLYAEDDYNNRPEFTEPEIRRTNLASVILKMESQQLGHIDNFPFIDPPDSRSIKDGYLLLHELNAVDKKDLVTSIGKQIARLPTDPKIGHMLLTAKKFNCLAEILVIGSALSVQDPRERPVEFQQQADEKHKQFTEQKSDFLFYLNLWQVYSEQRKHLSKNQLRKYCRQNFLSYIRMQEWRDIYKQLYTLFKETGAQLNQQPAEYHEIHKAILSGLLGNVGFRSEGHEYLGSRGISFFIHPSSSIGKKAKWIVCAELVETTKLYGRIVAQIEPEWIEALAPHLIKRNYSEPHWEKRAAQVAAYERTMLYGLTINPKRRVNYGPIAPVLSRELFIKEALINHRYNTKARFFENNQSIISEIEALEAKGRRRDILVDEHLLYAFYDERIPTNMYSGAAFEKWIRAEQKTNPDILFLQKDQLMKHEAKHINEEQYPNEINVGGVTLKLEYQFEPGHSGDGVTVVTPVMLLNQLQPEWFDWLVPGLLREKVIALIKTLPKSIRKSFVPVPNYADAYIESEPDQSLPMTTSVGNYLTTATGVNVSEDDWQMENLPDYYRMNFRVMDRDNNVLGTSQELTQLKDEFSDLCDKNFSVLATSKIEREGIDQWNFGDLPDTLEINHQGLSIKAYPALVDNDDTVSIKLFSEQMTAIDSMKQGIKRLFRLTSKQQMKYLRNNLPNINQMAMYLTPVCEKQGLIDDLEDAILDNALFAETTDIRTEEQFQSIAQQARKNLMAITNEICSIVNKVLEHYHSVSKRIKKNATLAWFEALSDINAQLACLIYRGFVGEATKSWLKHMPRYIKAINIRLDKLERSPAADKKRQSEIQGHWDRINKKLIANSGRLDDAWLVYRWMIEEMRVSLFAQELKTVIPISKKKLDRQYELIKHR